MGQRQFCDQDSSQSITSWRVEVVEQVVFDPSLAVNMVSFLISLPSTINLLTTTD